jgi:hypothetical protein
VKLPPTYIVEPETAKPEMLPLTPGLNVGSTAPVVVETLATRERDTPPMVVKAPATKSASPTRSIVLTELFGLGFQSGSTVPSARMWARLLRGRPSTVVNEPPTNQPPCPSSTLQQTFPLKSAKSGSG